MRRWGRGGGWDEGDRWCLENDKRVVLATAGEQRHAPTVLHAALPHSELPPVLSARRREPGEGEAPLVERRTVLGKHNKQGGAIPPAGLSAPPCKLAEAVRTKVSPPGCKRKRRSDGFGKSVIGKAPCLRLTVLIYDRALRGQEPR